MIRKSILFFCLFFSAFFAKSQSAAEYVELVKSYKISNPDSAFYFSKLAIKKLSNSPDNYQYAKLYNALGIAHWVQGNGAAADSILNLALTYVKKSDNDTLHIYILNNKSLLVQEQGNFDEAISLYRKALSIGIKNNIYIEVADTYNNIAAFYMSIGHSDSSEINFQKGIEFSELIPNKEEKILLKADLQTNLGSLYYRTGKRNLAFKSFFESMKLYEKQKIWSKCATVALNIGEVYFDKKDFNKCKTYVEQTLKYNSKSSIPITKANAFYLKGKIFFETKIFDSSEIYFNKSLALHEASQNYLEINSVYNSMGILYIHKNNYTEALNYFNKALEISTDLKDISSLCVNYENISTIHLRKGDLNTAKEYIDKAIALSDPKGNYSAHISVLNTAATVYEASGRYKEAFQFLVLHNMYSDTLASETNSRLQEEIEAIYQNEKKQKELERQSAINEKKSLELKYSEEQSAAKSFQLKLVFVGGFLLLIAMGLVIRSNIQRKKTNQLLAQKNDIIYKQNEEVIKQSTELQNKNHIIEEKQKEILDSINYAKRIQYTLLANDTLMIANLPNHFVFFQPKDIVSGDFYWATKHNDSFYLAICDSTGHGVPGAFMSLLNISFLSEAINEKNIEEPGKILDYVRKKLIDNISQEGGQDGMDGILIQLKNNGEVNYAAAHNAPLLIRNKEAINLSYDKMPIGKSEKDLPFQTFSLVPQTGDTLYLFTDGYPDQFGGDKGKKLKHKNLVAMILDYQDLSINNQKDQLEKSFNTWKGDYEQVDDVLLAGIRF